VPPQFHSATPQTDASAANTHSLVFLDEDGWFLVKPEQIFMSAHLVSGLPHQIDVWCFYTDSTLQMQITKTEHSAVLKHIHHPRLPESILQGDTGGQTLTAPAAPLEDI
jgi:hypothetical protein